MIDLLLASLIILFCALIGKITHKLGVPVLLAFVGLGMLVGENGIFKIPFDDYELSEFICTVSLIFIMFYGGFGTNWKYAKPVFVKASVLASMGTVLTAFLLAFACVSVFNMPMLEAFLLGAVLSSTDAASVFSVLRSKNLGLKENTASLLEVESGSNDPFAYMLTIIALFMLDNQVSGSALGILAFKQLLFGVLCGVIIAFVAIRILKYYKFPILGFDMAFMIGIALLAYSLATSIGGNGYLSVYIAGLMLGNNSINDKKYLVAFFDGFTSLTQMLIFFLLGFLALPSLLPEVFVTSSIIWFLLTFAVRPLAVALCLTPFKCSIPQQLLVSFAGLRGAASVVFAIMATVHEAETPGDLYHIVFCIVLLSICVQGTLLAPLAHRLKLCDENIDDSKSFNDYAEDKRVGFVSIKIDEQHPWLHKALHEVHIAKGMLAITLLRNGKDVLQGGMTVFELNDIVVLCAPKYQEEINFDISEEFIDADSKLIGQTIESFASFAGQFVVLIVRDSKTIIPNGKTIINTHDLLVVVNKN